MGKLVRLAIDTRTGDVIKKFGYNEAYEPLDLVCDEDTDMVFYKFAEKVYIQCDEGTIMGKVGYMCPYLGPSGRPCHLLAGQILEID